MAVEAVRIAVKYMTPVVYLSDGNIANGAEPWKLPDLDKLPAIKITHPTAGTDGPFLPYKRDPVTLARPWALPGTPGLEHRVGGLSKADLTGNVSYDPDNNQKMINYRAEKIRRIANDIPLIEVHGPDSGKLLVLGWGGTFGPIYQAIESLRGEGREVSHAQLTYMNPFPRNLGDMLARFEKILVPELNMGQLLMLLRNQFPGRNFTGYHKMQGQPFKAQELIEEISKHL